MNTLKKFRKERGFTQQEVADYLNVGRSSYTKYESAVHIPDIYVLDKLATLFNVTIDELVGRCVPEQKEDNSGKQALFQLVEKLRQLPPEDIKEIESYVEFKHAKKNLKKSTPNIS